MPAMCCSPSPGARVEPQTASVEKALNGPPGVLDYSVTCVIFVSLVSIRALSLGADLRERERRRGGEKTRGVERG